jgi:hypothetical protein
VAGTVLRENGKKLVPGVNPSITQYYVGVYHPVFGSGYIDPNGPLFALYNSDKPYNGTGTGDLLENDLGPPVITAGVVTATGAITTSAGVTAAAPIYTTSSGALTYAANIDVNPTASGPAGTYQVLTLSLTGNTILTATSIPAAGRLLYFIITADGSNRTVDFNSGFLTSYPMINGSVSLTGNAQTVTFSDFVGVVGTAATVVASTISTWTFISNGTKLIEVSRSISGTQ